MTGTGELVKADFGKRFMQSMLNHKITLEAGKYIFMIDPIWNDTVQNNDQYREILIDIYAPSAVALSQVDDY